MSDTASIHPRRYTVGRVALAGSWVLAGLGFLAAMAARVWTQDVPASGDTAAAAMILGVSTIASAVFWGGLALVGNRIAANIGVHGLAMIGMVSAVHFAVAAASRVGGQMLAAVLGPYAVFLQGIGDEAVPCLLSALLVVLRPKPGTLTFSLVTVFLLMVITSGTFGLTALIFVSASIALHEGLLAAVGITTAGRINHPGRIAPADVVLRMALAIGLANGATLYAQFAFYRVLFRLEFDPWYIGSVAGITGVVYGALGAAVGTVYGYRLRSVAP